MQWLALIQRNFDMTRTQLKRLVIERFRALNNVEIEFGDYITVICGKNGTSKSSILGIAAQIFSFEKDYADDTTLSFRKIDGGPFKSQYREHFRISDTFDQPGSMLINIELHDGYTNQTATARLELMKRGKSPRPVIRSNSIAKERGENTSRNFTHPVIFLSLKRLYPIADRDYRVMEFKYLKDHRKVFIGLTNELLNRRSSLATGTTGTISSAAAHGDNYDQESVSVGEDNAGQIILALMSFRKLKEEYANYRGGLLLIDEADAGLFPTAQVNLLKIFDRECRNLNLQVVITSHSPTLIEYAYEQGQQYQRRYKTIYLSNTYGNIQAMQDWSWPKISADINTTTIAASTNTSLPKVNVYFEDGEAEDFYKALLFRQPINKFTNLMSGVALGCGNYVNLIKHKVPEFSRNSVVCLDSDAANKVKDKNYKTVVLLPGNLPPDQLIFEYLYNLSADHVFWKNDLQFTRDVFTNSDGAAKVIREFEINENTVDVKAKVSTYQRNETPREIFKQFYKDSKIKELFASVSKSYNPWRHWIENNPAVSNEFLEKFREAIYSVMKNGYSVDVAKLVALKVKPKKVA